MAATLSPAVKEPKNFAAQMKGRLTLGGPQPLVKMMEGRNTGEDLIAEKNTTTTTISSHENIREQAVEGTLLNIVSQSLQGLDLLAELHGKYEQDAMFKPIIAKPNEF